MISRSGAYARATARGLCRSGAAAMPERLRGEGSASDELHEGYAEAERRLCPSDYAVRFLMSSAAANWAGVGGVAFIVISFVMSPTTLILPLMNACMAAC